MHYVARVLAGRLVHDDAARTVAERQFHGVRKAGAHIVLDDKAVHHEVDGVLLVLVQRGNFVEVPYLRLFAQRGHAHAHEAFGLELLEAVGVCALLHFHERREQDDARTFGHGHDVRDDLVRGAGFDGRAAVRAIDLAQPCEEHAQEVVDLRHRAHGGTRVMRRGLLFKRDSGGQALDLVHERLVHLGEEHTRVGGKRFHVAALALGVNDVESQRGLARARRPADHHELVARDIDADVLEIMLAGAFDAYAGARFVLREHGFSFGGGEGGRVIFQGSFFKRLMRRTTFS